MTGADVLDAILADEFPSSRRTAALVWAQAAIEYLWDLEQWTFRRASDTVKVTAGSHDVSELPDDYLIAVGLERADGTPLTAVPEHRVFAGSYLGTGNESAALPEAFCATAGGILVGPASSETNTGYLLDYVRACPVLADDTTDLGLPAGVTLATVFGGKARGSLLTKSDDAAGYFAAANTEIEQLRRSFLVETRGASVQARAYRPC